MTAGSGRLDLRAVEADLTTCSIARLRTHTAALLAHCRALRAEVARLHDALVVLERKALASPTDLVCVTGQVLHEMRQPALSVLAAVGDAAGAAPEREDP